MQFQIMQTLIFFQGDGSHCVSPRWTYSQHKRSVFNVTFIESVRVVASCCGSLHLWDPWVGECLHVDNKSSISAVTSNQRTIVTGTNDGSIKLIDLRKPSSSQELKVTPLFYFYSELLYYLKCLKNFGYSFIEICTDIII